MCECPSYQNINLLLPCSDTVTTGIIADESGIWKMELEFGKRIIKAAINVINNKAVVIPNVFNENYTHILKLYKQNGTLVNNTCYKIKTSLLIFSLIDIDEPVPVQRIYFINENDSPSRIYFITEDGIRFIL